jgi:hypothetical protein
MPIVKPRAHKVDVVRHDTRLLETNRDVVLFYAEFIQEKPDYVVNRLIETTIARDREYLAWRVKHPEITIAVLLERTRRRRPSKPSPALHTPAATLNNSTPSSRP